MSLHVSKDKDGKVIAVITFRDFYQYKGFTFEYHPYLGPHKLNKNLESSKREGKRFFDVFSEWDALSKDEKEQTKI